MEKDKEGVGGKELVGTRSKLPVRVIGGIETTSSSLTYISISKSMSSSTTMSSSSTTTRSRSTRSSSRSKNSVANNQAGSHTLGAVETHRGAMNAVSMSGGGWEFIRQRESNFADQEISRPEIISDTDDEDETRTVTNESFISAKTNATKLSASAVSAISRASQKSITVLSNVCRKAASVLTNNNNHQSMAPEVLYPPPSRSSSVRKGLSTLEEEFRAKSRASASMSGTNYRYDSDDGEDFGEDVLVEEEETRTAIFYKRVSKVLKFTYRTFVNVTCVPIYWLLVQVFVLEKWLLYRSPAPFSPIPPRRSSMTRNLAGDITHTHNYNGIGVPHHDCRPTTATTKFNAFAVTSQKSQSWARQFCWILWIVLALTLLGLGCSCVMWSDKDSTKNTWQCLRNCILPKPEPDSDQSYSNLVISEAATVKDIEDHDSRVEAEARILRNVDEFLDKFREEMRMKYSTPPVPVIVPTIPVQVTVPQPPPIDIEAVKEELIKYFDARIQQKCSECASTIIGGTETGDVHKIVKLAIAKYDADKTGTADLALESAGGSVVSTRCTKSSVKRTSVYTFFGLPFWHPPNNPRTIIQPGAVPGECWSYEGAEGFVVLQLVAPTVVTGFTLEHIPKELSPFGHIESAPKKFNVVGLMDYNNPETEFLLGSYVYEDNGVPIQYFPVQFMSNKAYPYVELKILSNHGSIEFTCVYRFRVHGYITDSKGSVPNEYKEPL